MQSYDIYELMIIPPNKKAEMIIEEINKLKPNLNLVSDLIALGANIDWQNHNEWTALHECAFSNHPEILRVLIDAGVDLNVKDEHGRTALHWCPIMNHPEIARILIDAGADVNAKEKDEWSLLHYSAKFHSGICKMLIDAGADKTIQDYYGFIPYELAQTKKLEELLKV